MIKYVKADESDYIKIGNKVYPRDASGYGYADVDYITRDAQQRYEKEQADAKEKARIAELQKKAEPLNKKIQEAIVDAGDNFDIDTLNAILVPSSGKAETLAGEIVRALERILYRNYNAGDRFFSGYGLDTCGGSAEFLIDNLPKDIGDFIYSIAERNLDGDEYDKALEKLEKDYIIPYLLEHTELLAIPADEDSRDYNAGYMEDYQPLYDFDFAIAPYEPTLTEAYNRGIINDRDIRNRIEDELRWNYSSGELDGWCDIDQVEIYNLTEEDYNEFRRNYEQILQGWADELLEEHPELDDDYDDDYDEDEDFDEED